MTSDESAAADQRKKRVVRFRLSTLFGLIALTCVALGLIAQRLQYAKGQANVARVVLAGVNRPGTSDNEVLYSYEFDANGKWLKNAKPRWPDFLLRVLGKDFFYSIESLEVASTEFDDESRRQIGDLTDLKTIALIGCELKSDDLACLQDLHKLEYLDVIMNELGEGAIKHLRNLTRLKHLELGYPTYSVTVSDADLDDLAQLQELEYLGLIYHGGITNAGVESIGRLKNLKRVVLNQTQVTEDGAAELRRLLPECTVVVGD